MSAPRTDLARRTERPDRVQLVLVGAGHAHVQVLRRFMMRPEPDIQITLVVDRPEAVYSGMVPGLVAGEYEVRELEIDGIPLARRAQARCILAAAVDVDPVARRIHVEGRPAVSYDVASLDVGSTIRGLDRPGVYEHALPTRPIRTFVDQLSLRLPSRDSGAESPPLIAVVGAGAAGMELAFTLRARLLAAGVDPKITVLCKGQEVMPRYTTRVAAVIRREAERRGIEIRTRAEVVAVEKDAVVLADDRVPCDLAVWATGAAPVPLFENTALPLDAAGFVRVEPTLQVVGYEDLFAVGDCASIDGYPWIPKAGVYAVREGPVLHDNLRARCKGRPLRAYRPQRDFLALLALGEGQAIGAKWGMSLAGSGMWRLKDFIDRRFMTRFQVLTDAGDDAPDFPSPEEMGMDPDEMVCGGCAAKVGASPLEHALARLPARPADPSVLVGLDRPDDAAVVELPRGDIVLSTIDAFRAFTDDPWLVGRVAAVNAASDVLAKGGRPRHALALVNVPEEDPRRTEETLYQVLAGVRVALDALGISLIGGHTTSGEDLYVGLVITGESEKGAILGVDGLRPGHRLVLTKPLGSGVVLAADMQGRARGAWVNAAFESLVRANDAAARIAREHAASACTDVSGFGFAGHLGEMLRASRMAAVVHLERVPALPGALSLFARGMQSTYHEQNREARRGLAIPDALERHPATELLFDPQTSGGLLFGVTPEREDAVLAALREAGDVHSAVVGEVCEPRGDGALFEVAP